MSGNANYNFNTALITGGGGGIGRALAEHFISKGKKVIICGRTESKLQATSKEIGCSYMVLDVADTAAIPDFAKRLIADHPDLDCLVNNAGVGHRINLKSTEDTVDSLAMMDAGLDTNVRGILHLTMHLLPQIRAKKGAIYNIGSGLGFTPASWASVYCATKAFVHSWSWSLRAQLWSDGVRVVEIIPSLVETDLNRRDPEYAKNPRPHAMTMEVFMDGVVADLAAGKEEIVIGRWRPFAEKSVELLLPMFEMLNGDAMKAAGREHGLDCGQTEPESRR